MTEYGEREHMTDGFGRLFRQLFRFPPAGSEEPRNGT